MMATLLSLALSQTACFLPTDSTPGWRQVALSNQTQGLAAPEGVDQFRVGEPVTIIETRSALFLEGIDDGVGVTLFELKLDEGARSIELRFKQSLRGAKVDAEAFGELGKMTLLREERIGASKLSLAWGMNDVKRLRVRVHQHLRKTPILEGYSLVRQVPSERLHLNSAFLVSGVLSFLQPLGPPVRLCIEPQRELTIRGQLPTGGIEPMPVSIQPAR